jgi:putative ABC transport system permease protein
MKTTLRLALRRARAVNIGPALQDVLLLMTEHRMRTGLTVLGIAVGVWALVTLLSMGLAARVYVDNKVATLGTDLLIVTPGNTGDLTSFFDPRVQQSLTAADAQSIREQVPGVALAVPTFQLGGTVHYRDRKTAANIVGTTPDYFILHQADVRMGRVLAGSDGSGQLFVAVLGEAIRERLFSNQNPLGETVRYQGRSLETIGVIRSHNDGMLGESGRDKEVVVPLTTAQHKLAGARHVQRIYIKPESDGVKERIKREVELTLLARHTNLAKQGLPYTVVDMGQIATIAQQLTGGMTALLVSIAAVSLVVGGIGVMNVMLVSVNERINEIGIRRAVGARQKDIEGQFLIEASVLTFLGAGVGLLLSVLTLGLANFFLPWETSIGFLTTFAILLISAVVGLFFGLYPAKRAASLAPIEALRYD